MGGGKGRGSKLSFRIEKCRQTAERGKTIFTGDKELLQDQGGREWGTKWVLGFKLTFCKERDPLEEHRTIIRRNPIRREREETTNFSLYKP